MKQKLCSYLCNIKSQKQKMQKLQVCATHRHIILGKESSDMLTKGKGINTITH